MTAMHITASKAAVLKGTDRQSQISDSCPQRRQIEHRLQLLSQPTCVQQYQQLHENFLRYGILKLTIMFY